MLRMIEKARQHCPRELYTEAHVFLFCARIAGRVFWSNSITQTTMGLVNIDAGIG
jgi:hypothetical protein